MAINAANMDERLSKVRQLMQVQNLSALVIPSCDPHQSEYIPEHFARLKFISGFSGSNGTGVITQNEALLWTDGRYFIQAQREMTSSWTLMRLRVNSTPTVEKWLSQNIKPNSTVAVLDVMSIYLFASYKYFLESCNINFIAISNNPIDEVWGKERPKLPSSKLFIHGLEFSGESAQSKIAKLRQVLEAKHEMQFPWINLKQSADSMFISDLDQIAWLLNLRALDLPNTPTFLSYFFISQEQAILFIDFKKVDGNDDLKSYLSQIGVTLEPYSQTFSILIEITGNYNTMLVDEFSSQAIANALTEGEKKNGYCISVLYLQSPIELSKAIKNQIELEGFRNCHIRDAVALVNFFFWLEQELENGNENLNEINVCTKLNEFRSVQKHFFSLSFETISCVGSNAASPHYKPTPESNKKIDKNHLYLLDSGAQYHDGTTDVTRTVHFGNPTSREKECFTRVLQGHIAIDTCVFPKGTNGLKLDILARMYLWRAGLDYLHGTGHGVGSFLNVHEGPHSIGGRGDTPLYPGMTITDEPGYYEEGNFGIRIENVLIVKKAEIANTFLSGEYYCFEPITLVPIQKKMFELNILSNHEINWINEYHKKCWEIVGPFTEGKVKDWLRESTLPI
eukprot:TRINITY_DN1618_c0_g1_i1.p1 TRINITY_DN1618_c0_g1~~TRINITY_DN1618_c0_g1_i1.p1  ORF type:complete len:623 (+),score=239.91 TRINITY_DN1618_c0_g1_i1:59-1927(+)